MLTFSLGVFTVFLNAATAARTRRSGRHDIHFPGRAPFPACYPSPSHSRHYTPRPAPRPPVHVRPRPARPAHPRLILRPLARDADAIQRLFPQWEVVRYLADQIPWPYPPDGARHFVENLALPAMARGQQWRGRSASRPRPRR